MVKKTVNFDDPGTYHFYFGDEVGSPGTILTFFPGKGIGQGHTGSGMVTNIGYAVPKDSLATDNPGFTKDEPVNELGTSLKLLKQHEGRRKQIEEILPAFNTRISLLNLLNM